ncbi:MAG TPA: hypothetical protein VLJ78_14395 [Microvirga sp.]|nr:hypothetical protein [Microvirga sp.]
MSDKPFDPVPKSNLGKDFAIFRQPGFLITLAIYLLMTALGIALLVWANTAHGISPLPSWLRT